jgi:cytochrome c oxidase assembly factor CtaG
MQWWCSAQTTAWGWTWQAYPGVWLFVLLIALLFARVQRRTGSSVRDKVRFGIGLWLLWLALDWPIGALGAGYLASVHMLQYLLIALLAPAFLLLGVPKAGYERLRRSRFAAPLRIVTQPLVALAVFSVVMYATHVPSVVDGLMATQAGSFVIDVAWLVGGLVFWWPVLAPVPERPGFPYPLRMVYLLVATVINTIPYGFLTFGELPFYGIYELAPPVTGISTRQDQQIAGLLMKIGGGVILWTAITILFFQWFHKEEAA